MSNVIFKVTKDEYRISRRHLCGPLSAVALAIGLASCTTVAATDFHVFYLGGQSNMDGFGDVRELPEELSGEVDGVPIFHGNPAPDKDTSGGKGRWTTLRPGHGTGFSSDGDTVKHSERFGVEITFARRLQELLPDQRIALIKYSRGGTSIAQAAAGRFGCWEPDFEEGEGDGAGINQYDHFLSTLRLAFAEGDIDGDGKPDRLIPAGIVWMQGESDASYGPEIAGRYRANLKRLIDLIRAALRIDDLPVVIGRISDSGRDEEDGKVWDDGDIVREAQAAFVDADRSAALVTTTDEYGYSDKWHYDSAGYIDLGRKFAEAMHDQISDDRNPIHQRPGQVFGTHTDRVCIALFLARTISTIMEESCELPLNSTKKGERWTD